MNEPGLRYVIFLGDGMADLPIPELGGRTPLQVARKPAMDEIARRGRCGRFVTVEDNMPPGSEVANLTVLGYDPRECYQGRGVIEAAAMGVPLTDTDLALRCNLICLEDGRIKNHSAGHISTDEARPLIAAMNEAAGADCRFHAGISYRHLAVLPHGEPDLECSPPHDHAGEPAADLFVRATREAARPTAELLNRLIHLSWEVLGNQEVNRQRKAAGKDPANSVWFWSPGPC
ncbi:MAG TPA: phosphoglycerate mutase, partial [candidate division WOR-3 bacterium]|nr:phosphoglycerate mutase [candidate division WOR-3 bacterium]